MSASRLMPRPLAESTFLRVYVMLALVLTFGLALVAFTLIDKVRREHYRELLAEAPMTLLTAELGVLPQESRQAWLDEQSRALGIQLELYEWGTYSLSYFERARLEAGRTLAYQEESQRWILYRRLPGEQWLLKAELTSMSERQLTGLAQNLGQWLSAVEGEQRRERLERLKNPAFTATLSEQVPEGLDPERVTRMQDSEVVVRLLPQRWAMSLFLRLPTPEGGIEWVQVGPLKPFEPMSLTLSLTLLVIMLAVLAGIIYMIVRGLEARVARLELAATRIAGGHLDTRVKVDSSDFLGRLGMAFNGMAAQVQALLQSQQDMIRGVSHELRTPVARIRFAVQMVEDMIDSPPVRRQLKGIDGDIEELDTLIDEILTYARLGGGQVQGMDLKSEEVDCRALAVRVIETLAPLHGRLSLELAPGPEIEVVAEPRYLQRALQNLVANACRHADSRVMISIKHSLRTVQLAVEDDGPGVPENDRLKVFKPFSRLDDSRTRRSGGYGLGLSIVQKIMHWHRGSVVIDDSPTLGGARFTLQLPQAALPATPAEETDFTPTRLV
ncbi:ATP-binding protein [Pistricoccus aurantiacus]|uniref:ATP-binding protein n=1 Tax=Pistricoccus aurantiacus TaxID=1883414 RepID=UPI00362D7B6C